MKKTLIAAFAAAASLGALAAVYKNPVLPMDFSDPDVCMGNPGEYYMTASSFGGLPGLPILKSVDLLHWKYVGYALARHPWQGSWRDESPLHGKAVWAPSIRARKRKIETRTENGVSLTAWTEFSILHHRVGRGFSEFATICASAGGVPSPRRKKE